MDGWKRGSCRGDGGEGQRGWARRRRDTWDGQVRGRAMGRLGGPAADVHPVPQPPISLTNRKFPSQCTNSSSCSSLVAGRNGQLPHMRRLKHASKYSLNI